MIFRYRREFLVSGHRSARVGRLLSAVGTVVVLNLAAGCSEDAPGLVLNSPSSSPTMDASTTTDPPSPTTTPWSTEQQILQAYEAYFAATVPAQRADEATRVQMMSQVAVDPELTATLDAMAAAESLGEQYFGERKLRPEIQFVEDSLARIHDCQDTSDSGRRNVTTGEVTTRGAAGAFAVSTMVLGDDGAWRLGALSYPGDTSAPTCEFQS